jgi:hypothetical protein
MGRNFRPSPNLGMVFWQLTRATQHIKLVLAAVTDLDTAPATVNINTRAVRCVVVNHLSSTCG